MKLNVNLKTTGQAIETLNESVLGKEHDVLTKQYRGDAPLQDRVDVLEQTAAGLLVTKYIGPVSVTNLGVPQSLGGQPAIELLDAMVFAQNHPNDKKAIGLIAQVPASKINDPVNFPEDNVITYTLTLTVFASQEDASGHTKVLLQGDSPEYKFEIATTINFNTEAYVIAPVLVVKAITINSDHVIYDGGTVADAIGDLTHYKANRVVGGDFDNMDLKEVAEKLDSDKEDKIIDTGWQDLSLTNDATGNVKIRKIGKQVFLFGVVTFAGNSYNYSGFALPVGYRIYGFDGKFEKTLQEKESTTFHRITFEVGGFRVYPYSSLSIGKEIVFNMTYVAADE